MNSFWRKLDILNRLYILQFGEISDIAALNQPFIANLPHLKNTNPKTALHLHGNDTQENLDLSDKLLLLNIITHKRFEYIVNQIFLNEILGTKDIWLSSKILLKLKHHYQEDTLKTIIQKKHATAGTKPWLHDALINHEVATILNAIGRSILKQLQMNASFYRERDFYAEDSVDNFLIEHFVTENTLNQALGVLQTQFILTWNAFKSIRK